MAGVASPVSVGFAAATADTSAPRDTIRPVHGDSTVVAVVRVPGAVVEFPTVVRVRFAAGAFATAETVRVWISNLPSTEDGGQSYDIGDGGRPPFLAKDVTVSGSVEPRQGFHVEFMLPDSSLECVAENRAFRVFQHFVGGGDMEALTMYEPLPTTLDAVTRTIRARVGAPPVQDGPGLYEVLHVGCHHR